ncbi:hypothetical protein PFISCL1PPCAC_5457, partial [Pristionchus fissidentatus]
MPFGRRPCLSFTLILVSTAPADLETAWKTKFLKATKIEFDFEDLMDEDLPYMVKNKEELIVVKESYISADGLYVLQKEMREAKLDFIRVETDDAETKDDFIWKILDNEEDYNLDNNEDAVHIRDGNLRVVISES